MTGGGPISFGNHGFLYSSHQNKKSMEVLEKSLNQGELKKQHKNIPRQAQSLNNCTLVPTIDVVKLSGRAARVWLITFVLRGPRPAPERSRTSLIDRNWIQLIRVSSQPTFVNGLKRLGSSNARLSGRFNLVSLAGTYFLQGKSILHA